MSFENSILPFAYRTLPQNVMENYTFENKHCQETHTSLTPECLEAWIVLHCLEQYYLENYQDYDKMSGVPPQDRPPQEKDLFRALHRWRVAIQALAKAKKRHSDHDNLYETLAKGEIIHLHDELNGFSDRLR